MKSDNLFRFAIIRPPQKKKKSRILRPPRRPPEDDTDPPRDTDGGCLEMIKRMMAEEGLSFEEAKFRLITHECPILFRIINTNEDWQTLSSALDKLRDLLLAIELPLDAVSVKEKIIDILEDAFGDNFDINAFLESEFFDLARQQVWDALCCISLDPNRGINGVDQEINFWIKFFEVLNNWNDLDTVGQLLEDFEALRPAVPAQLVVSQPSDLKSEQFNLIEENQAKQIEERTEAIRSLMVSINHLREAMGQVERIGKRKWEAIVEDEKRASDITSLNARVAPNEDADVGTSNGSEGFGEESEEVGPEIDAIQITLEDLDENSREIVCRYCIEVGYRSVGDILEEIKQKILATQKQLRSIRTVEEIVSVRGVLVRRKRRLKITTSP